MAERRRRDDDAPVARAFWSGTLTFGLVSIPVDLLAANRPRGVSLRMLAPDGQPLSRRYVCPDHEEVLDDDEIVRGYEVEDGEFVLIDDEELEALSPTGTRDITLERFVERSELEPLRFERAYFLAPSGQSSRSYHLLVETMERTGRSGIARFVMRDKEYLAAILARGGILRGEILRFEDQIRSAEDVGLPEPIEPPRSRVKEMDREIGKHTGELRRDELDDEYAERLEELAERKRRKGDDVIEAESAGEPEDGDEGGEVIDLMKVLKERLGIGARGGRRGDGERLEELSKKELYERAQDVDLPGRSKMSKEELVEALRKAG